MKRTNNAETVQGVGERVVRELVILSNDVAHGSIMLQGMRQEVVTSQWSRNAKRTWQLIDDLRQATEEDEVTDEDEGFTVSAYESRKRIRQDTDKPIDMKANIG